MQSYDKILLRNILLLLIISFSPTFSMGIINNFKSINIEKPNQDHITFNDKVNNINSNIDANSGPKFNLKFLNNGGFNVTHLGDSFEGYNLFVLERRNNTVYLLNRSLLITDMNGNIMLERKISTLFGLSENSAEFINSTTILYGRPNATLWNLETNRTIELDFSGHHELEYNPVNNTIFTFDKDYYDINGTVYAHDKILEYNLSGSLIWSLSTETFISNDQWCPFQDYTRYGFPDVTHSNTIFFDAEEDLIYYNSKTSNTFYEIDHKTGKPNWGVGEFGNFSLFDKHGNQKHNLWYHSHAVEKINDNLFILFDNDVHNQTNPVNQRSRILEIVVDEDNMVANESWSWTGSEKYFTGWLGDADRLPNGNRLGTFGTPIHIDSTVGARLVEVNDTGQIVWELNFPHTESYSHAIYRCERFRFSPILSSLSDFYVDEGSSVVINWQTWYNFRSKIKVAGSYALYLNGKQIEKGIHTFNKFWLPANLTCDLGQMESGEYNLTIILTDEGGHKVTNSVNIYVKPMMGDSTTRNASFPFVFYLIGLGFLVLISKRFRAF